MLTHLDVSWRFGPLRYVFVSPAMHRWHHARGNTRANFAGMFAFIDFAFGTFSLPDGEPDKFGSHVGHGVVRQSRTRFARRSAGEDVAERSGRSTTTSKRGEP